MSSPTLSQHGTRWRFLSLWLWGASPSLLGPWCHIRAGPLSLLTFFLLGHPGSILALTGSCSPQALWRQALSGAMGPGCCSFDSLQSQIGVGETACKMDNDSVGKLARGCHAGTVGRWRHFSLDEFVGVRVRKLVASRVFCSGLCCP